MESVQVKPTAVNIEVDGGSELPVVAVPNESSSESSDVQNASIKRKKGLKWFFMSFCACALSYLLVNEVIYKPWEVSRANESQSTAVAEMNRNITSSEINLDPIPGPKSEIPGPVKDGFAPYDKSWGWIGVLEAFVIDYISVGHHAAEPGSHMVKKGIEAFAFGISVLSLGTFWSFLEIAGDAMSICAGEEFRELGPGPALALMTVGALISMWPFAAMMEQMSFSIGTGGTWIVWILIHAAGYGASFTLAGAVS